jgi:hypothetical protein
MLVIGCHIVETIKAVTAIHIDLAQVPARIFRGDAVAIHGEGPWRTIVRASSGGKTSSIYRLLLETVRDEAERRTILKLLAEEQQKQRAAGDPPDNQ